MSSSNTDFDANLVDWLYGELDAETQASFEAHLEANPEHKAEAQALRETRVAFQELPEAEPPNALTAMLMQQAATTAQPKQGMWAAMVSFFQPVILHPAASAMATIIVVAGVAGTLYLRNGKMVAETTVASSEAIAPAPRPGGAQPASLSAPELKERAGTFADDEDNLPTTTAVAPAGEQAFGADIASPEQEESLRAAKEETGGVRDEKLQEGSKNRLNEAVALGSLDGYAFDGDMASNAISGGAIADTMATERKKDSFAQPPGRRLRSDAKPKSAKSSGPPPSSVADVQPAPKAGKKSIANSWEQKQVVSFQSLARKNRCRDAGRIANDLRDKSPLAYDRNVKGTPEESDCRDYIASESKRRKTARTRKELAKSKARKKGQGKSVPKNAVAAPAEDFAEDEPAQATGNGL